jgi:PhzF family phenazine biosynthesis protein
MATPIAVVDAFTHEPFRGNPAAVCILEKPAEEAWMQRLAAEMNLSETAFLVKTEQGFDLRWFTPAVEVALCGHATLASAHLLWESGRVWENDALSFSTKSGVLKAVRKGDDIELDFPARPCAETAPPEGLLEALGCRATFIGKSTYDYLVMVTSEDVVRALRPDHAKLRTLDVRGVIVTARANTTANATEDPDFVSRFFAPGAGVEEDPVTGSAHCTLAPFWASRLHKHVMTGYQASKRGGTVKVRVDGDRIALSGRAVTVWRGELLV